MHPLVIKISYDPISKGQSPANGMGLEFLTHLRKQFHNLDVSKKARLI